MTTKVWGSLQGDGCTMLGLYGKQQNHPLCTGDCGVYLNKAAGRGVSHAVLRELQARQGGSSTVWQQE